jgi:hypothetical protein
MLKDWSWAGIFHPLSLFASWGHSMLTPGVTLFHCWGAPQGGTDKGISKACVMAGSQITFAAGVGG